MKKKIIFILMLAGASVNAQVEPLFSQYYISEFLVNPAISGNKSYNSINIQTRKQWLGFEDAPITTNVFGHGSLDDRSAVGAYLMFDKLGPVLQANTQINYAYHIPLDYDRVNLSFGIGAKLIYYSIDFNKEDLPPTFDPAFSAKNESQTSGDASAGAYLYGRNFHIGYSISNLFQSNFKSSLNENFPNQLFRNYYTIAAYRFNIINNDILLEPSFLVRKHHTSKTITDLTTRIIYLDDYWTGLTYRTEGAGVFSFGFKINNMLITYSYDHSFSNEIMQYAYGTHEIGLGFRINTNATKRHISFWDY